MKNPKRVLIFLVVLLTGGITFAQGNPYEADMVVALDGSGNFTSLQAAIDAVPSNSDIRTVIYIKRGTYNTEKLIVPGDKINVTLIGESREETVISYHIFDCEQGKCPAEDAALWTGDNIRTSATLTIMADGFRAENLTIENTAGPVGQAQAITVRADRVEFVNCNLNGYQDTIYLWDAGKRSYFENCMVIGRTDYIYGGGISFFNNCEIRSWGGGWITAPSTPADQAYGFVFSECDITYADNSPRAGDDGNLIAMGRPWHNCPKVTWLNCEITGMMNPLGWPTTWNMPYAPDSSGLHLYEYGNTGAGADLSGRANWFGIRGLSEAEAANYSAQAVLAGDDNWDPTATPPAVTTFDWTGAADTTGWMTPENWNPQDTPRIGEVAVVDGEFLVAADGGNFEADLTIRGGSILEVSDSSFVTLLSIGKGSISTLLETALEGRIRTKDSTILSVSGELSIYAQLLGVHPIFKEETGKVILLDDNRGYSGEWVIREGTLEGQVEYSLGNGSVQLLSGATLAVDHSNAIQPISPIRVESGSMLELNATVTLSEFYIDGAMQPPGEYDAKTHPDLISGPGKVVVGRPTRFLFVGGASGNWDVPDHFVPALLPEEGDTVLCELEIETTSTVFSANLFISNGGRLRLRGDPSKNHRSTGDIHLADGTSVAYNTGGTGMYINAPIAIDGDVILNMESGNEVGSTMTLQGSMAGEGTVYARNNGKGNENFGKVLLQGDNRDFSGVWDLRLPSDKYPDLILETWIEGASMDAFGTGKFVAGDFNRVILNHKFCVTDTLDLTLEGSGIAELKTLVVVKGFYLNGVKQENGTYSSVTHPGVFEGEGSLVVDSELKLPAGPTDLMVSRIDYRQASIAWTINADNAGGHVILKDLLTTDTVEVDTALITGLKPAVSYSIGVFTYNLLGNSDTIFVEFTTPEEPVGMAEAELDIPVIFPNPAEDILYLSGAHGASWELYSLKGQLLKEGRSSSIETSWLPPGIYLLKVQIGEGDPKQLRFMKE